MRDIGQMARQIASNYFFELTRLRLPSIYSIGGRADGSRRRLQTIT